MKRVWIVGAGYVGGTLARMLAADGDETWVLRRTGAQQGDNVKHARVDVLDPASLAAVPADPTHVVFCLAAKAPMAGEPDAYVDGLGHVLAELGRRGAAPRVILTSSTGVYGQSAGEWVSERSEVDRQSSRAARLLRAEQLVTASPYPSVVVRLSGIYGPGRTSMVTKLRSGEARMPRTVRWTNRIHRDDCALALRHVLRMEAPAPLYLASDHEPAALGDVLAWLAARLGVPVPPLEEVPREGMPTYRSDGNKRCDGALLRAAGFTFRFPTYREGYGALLEGGLA